MPDLSFEVVSAYPARDSLLPVLAFDLRVTNRFAEQSITTVRLKTQIWIEAARRRYTPAEQRTLHDLFDEPSRWRDTLRSFTWANIATDVPAFFGSTIHPIPVPCLFDPDAAVKKYFNGLEGGDVPLTFLFSGTVFYISPEDAVQAAPISREKEARFRLSLSIWNELRELHSVAL